MTKTIWQRIYSFFGFWSYTLHDENGAYRIYYFTKWPWHFQRKVDVFRIKV